MSVIHSLSHMEVGFAIGGLVMTVLVGAVIIPVIRKVLNDEQDPDNKR